VAVSAAAPPPLPTGGCSAHRRAVLHAPRRANADSGEAFSHDASYAWVTRKYTPAFQWFEVVFIIYKVVTVFTSSTSICTHRLAE
jgi:hypothetical protein